MTNLIYEVPQCRNGSGLLGRLLSGWPMKGVRTLQNDVPYTLPNAVTARYEF